MRNVIALLALLAALPLRAASVHGTLDEPHAGAVLRGGATAEIAWSSRELPRFAEEWEAFLSADGGAHYTYRVTPHLDLDRKRFSFVVPNVETEHARILIRAGDESNEVEVELDATFSVRADRLQAMATPPATVDEDERGEAARPGEAGVVEWVDGDRDGSHLAPRSALRNDDVVYAAAPIATSETVEAAAPAPLNLSQLGSATMRATVARAVPPLQTRAARSGRAVLLACRRLNV